MQLQRTMQKYNQQGQYNNTAKRNKIKLPIIGNNTKNTSYIEQYKNATNMEQCKK